MLYTLNKHFTKFRDDALIAEFVKFIEEEYRQDVININTLNHSQSDSISIFSEENILIELYGKYQENIIQLLPSFRTQTIGDNIVCSLGYADNIVYLLTQELLFNKVISIDQVPNILYALQYGGAQSYDTHSHKNNITENVDHKIAIAIYDAIQSGNDYWIAIKLSITGIDSLRVGNLEEITRLLNTGAVVITRKIPMSKTGFEKTPSPYIAWVKKLQNARTNHISNIKNIEEVVAHIHSLPGTVTLATSKNRYVIGIKYYVEEDICLLDEYQKNYPDAKILLANKGNRKRFRLEGEINLKNK